MKDDSTTIEEIKQKLLNFINERDWDQYHIPKDVALALSIEVAEILEHFRFKTDDEIAEWIKDKNNKQELADEIADTGMFLIDLARVCDIDLAEAIESKMKKSALRYPADVVRGKPHKYTYYQKKE
ncbi:MAG: nucleotide pyrophosphohydrolase [Candidatus Woesearchaeota archaeon]